jgi:hypothetical protein
VVSRALQLGLCARNREVFNVESEAVHSVVALLPDDYRCERGLRAYVVRPAAVRAPALRTSLRTAVSRWLHGEVLRCDRLAT